MILAFIGKGGVGKTSVSSAVALNLASFGRTAIVSSDFMSSLRVIFPLDPDNLTVIELKEKDVAESWKRKYGSQVADVLQDFVEFDDWILDHIAYSPGVAEEFMISNIFELEDSGKYDYIVWDTAASSSTMHLLFLEREFYAHLDRDVQLFLRFRDRFRSNKTYRILQEWKNLANRVWDQLTGTGFYLVTTTDELSLVQADEIENDLRSLGIAVKGRIVNRLRTSLNQSPSAYATIPELEGSAQEIVNSMRKHLTGKFPQKEA